MAFWVFVYFLFRSVRIPRQSTQALICRRNECFMRSRRTAYKLAGSSERIGLFGRHSYTIVLGYEDTKCQRHTKWLKSCTPLKCRAMVSFIQLRHRTPSFPIYLSEAIHKPFALSRVFLLSSGGKSVLLVKKKAPSRSGFPHLCT